MGRNPTSGQERVSPIRAILCGAVAMLALTMVPSASIGQGSEIEAVRMLADSIVVEARRLPAGSEARLYEARFAFMLEASTLECPRLLDALRLAMGSGQLTDAGRAALRELYDSLAICRRGTAGGPNNAGVSPFGPMIDFASGGGGTDYAR
jgi:hypothetical protein